MHGREGYSSYFVCLSVTLYFGEDAVYRVKTYIHQYSLGDDLSPLNVALFFFLIEASGTSAITAVMYRPLYGA